MPLPVIVIICCEGRQTEPQYFAAMIKQQRISQGRTEIRILKGKGQHKKLVDNCASARTEIGRKKKVKEDAIEVWAVCDKDQMDCKLDELQAYAIKNDVRLAFTDPQFEAYLLQHFGLSATKAKGKTLEAQLTKVLRPRTGKSYDKKDLSWVYPMLDNEPGLLKNAVANADQLKDSSQLPYMSVQDLVKRLLELAPPVN